MAQLQIGLGNPVKDMYGLRNRSRNASKLRPRTSGHLASHGSPVDHRISGGDAIRSKLGDSRHRGLLGRGGGAGCQGRKSSRCGRDGVGAELSFLGNDFFIESAKEEELVPDPGAANIEAAKLV